MVQDRSREQNRRSFMKALIGRGEGPRDEEASAPQQVAPNGDGAPSAAGLSAQAPGDPGGAPEERAPPPTPRRRNVAPSTIPSVRR